MTNNITDTTLIDNNSYIIINKETSTFSFRLTNGTDEITGEALLTLEEYETFESVFNRMVKSLNQA